MTKEQDDQDRWNAELAADLQKIVDDEDNDTSAIFHPPEGVPLSDAPAHTQAIFIRKQQDRRRTCGQSRGAANRRAAKRYDGIAYFGCTPPHNFPGQVWWPISGRAAQLPIAPRPGAR